MRVLVTGGAGFVGSHVVDSLVAEGHEVVVLDSFEPEAHGSRPTYLHDRATVELVHGSVCDPEAVGRALGDGVDAVCHQASRVGLGVDFGDVVRYVQDNDVGTAVLLGALFARRFAGRFVLASSMVVYGEGRYRCEVHGVVRPGPRSVASLDARRFEPSCPTCGADLVDEAVPETSPMDPRNVYAATKLHQEHLAFAFERESPGASVVALRYHNVYGPRMPNDTPYAGVASIFRSALEAGRTVQVFEDGRQRRDFVHVRDVATANLLALTATDVSGAFNVASGSPRTIGEMAVALASAFPGSRPVEITGRYRLGDVRHVVGSPDRARSCLGFSAAVAFESGMREFASAPLRAPSPVVPRGRP